MKNRWKVGAEADYRSREVNENYYENDIKGYARDKHCKIVY